VRILKKNNPINGRFWPRLCGNVFGFVVSCLLFADSVVLRFFGNNQAMMGLFS